MKQTLNQLLVELDGFKESGKNKAASSEALLIYSDRGNYCHCRYQLPGVARQVRGCSWSFGVTELTSIFSALSSDLDVSIRKSLCPSLM